MENRTQFYAFFKRYMFRVLMIVLVLLPFFIGCGGTKPGPKSPWKWSFPPHSFMKDSVIPPIISSSYWDPKGKEPKDISRLFNIHGGNWWNYYERGLAFMEEGFWDYAIEDFEKARSLRGEDQTSARTYGVRRMDYFVNRELGIAYYKNAQKQNPKFLKGEFKLSSEKIEDLCKTIAKDVSNIPLKSKKNTLEWFNELLEVSNFYDDFKNKKSNKRIEELAVETAQYRTKRFGDLKDEEKITIKRLNRLLLEETYSATPKIEDQYQLAMNRLVASLDMIESSRTQFYLSSLLKEKKRVKSVPRPTITIQQDGEILEDSFVLLSAKIEDGSFVDSIWINNKKTFIQVGKTSFEFKKYIELPKNGIIEVVATNLAGETGTSTIKLCLSQQNKIVPL